MCNTQEFDLLISQLFDHAVQEFQSTEQYKLLKEKLEQMEADCTNMFIKNLNVLNINLV